MTSREASASLRLMVRCQRLAGGGPFPVLTWSKVALEPFFKKNWKGLKQVNRWLKLIGSVSLVID
jgi:hypothetical protein